jgi:oligopeptide/dipeptide ABC transporter ATP-binding protein
VDESNQNIPLLSVNGLSVRYGKDIPLIESASFSIQRGETVGLVGESGCGKSLTSLAVMGLLAEGLDITGGSIEFEGIPLTSMETSDLRKLRGNRMAMIFQEPLSALNPVMTVGAQVVEVLRIHQQISKSDAKLRAIELFDLVRIPDPAARFNNYPHQLSGGMGQRVVIAIAIACNPALLIADEPTTALDVTVQAQILRLLKQLQRDNNIGLLFITHDLGVVRQVADHVVVMYAGSIAEEGLVNDVLDNPQHPYTAGLLSARPHGSYIGSGHRLAGIKGFVPEPHARPKGCCFEPRCENAQKKCRTDRPASTEIAEHHVVRCFHPVGKEG